MMDIDLGPAVAAIFTIFVVVPSAVGLVVGVLFGYFLFRKHNFSKLRKTLFILLCGVILAVLFPIILISFEKQYSASEDGRMFKKTKQYEEYLIRNYVVNDIKITDETYTITLTVPIEGDYWLNVLVYQGDSCREVYNPLFAIGTKSIKLVSGWNTIKGNINDSQYATRDGCISLYSRQNSTIPANVKISTINPTSPMDFVIEIKTPEDKLLNERKNIVVTNPNSVIKDGSLLIYSSRLSTSKDCPIYNHIDYSVCVAEDKLKIN